MRKRILIVAGFFVVSFIIFYKYKQNEFLKTVEPQIETKESILNYAIQHNILGDIYVSTSNNQYDSITKYFNYGNIYVFDSNLELLDCNYTNLGGRCFQDISDDICESNQINKRNIKINTNKSLLEKILNNSNNITSNDSIFKNKYDKIYVYTWVKYAKASIYPSSLEFMKCLENQINSKKVLLISLNLDKMEENL